MIPQRHKKRLVPYAFKSTWNRMKFVSAKLISFTFFMKAVSLAGSPQTPPVPSAVMVCLLNFTNCRRNNDWNDFVIYINLL